ncbi:MAG: zinc ribbon domain-containing protein [Acidobacteriota bacterium]|nr:zinc ribbon domain-containing protein [Acidobacteriota bacterium]
MPRYEYECAECGKVFEAFQKINDDPLTECKFCKGKVEQLISQTSFQLKGGGWYVTDYAGRSSKPEADSPKSDGAGKTAENKPDSASKSPENTGKSSGGKTD